ncbi:MAG: hypothetical protein U1F43_02740 [Myxococcota bacterium]
MKLLLCVGFVWVLPTAACGSSTETVNTVHDATDITVFGDISLFDTTDTHTPIDLPPDFGNACLENTDCSTGYCVEGPNGSVCTKTCVELCPDGWDCRGVQAGSADITFLCVPSGSVDHDTIGGDSTTTDTGTSGDTTETSVTTDAIGGDTTTSPGDTSVVGDTGGGDTTEPPLTGNACTADFGQGTDNLYDEASASGGSDFPDCVTGCDHAAQTGLWEIDLRSTVYTGALGTLDDDSHALDVGPGPDIDIVAIRAEPRTMLEFAVQKDSAAGLMDPVVYVSDGFQVRTYSSDVSPTNLCARTTIAYPYVSASPLFVVIEDAANYEAYSPDGYGPGIVGGAGYGYTLRIRTGGFSPVELGNLASPSTTTKGGQELVLGGETKYYRFYAPGTSHPTVTITRAAGANAAFIPAVAGMKTIAGELVWQKADYDSDENGSVILQGNTAFRPCIPASECPDGFTCPSPICTASNVEFVFAVYDWNGAADPGAFTYDVKVQVP